MTLTFTSTILAAAIGFSLPQGPAPSENPHILQIKGAEHIDRLQAVERLDKNRRSLPQTCLRSIQSGDQTTSAYSADCLNTRFSRASELPDNCEWIVRTSSGTLDLFRADCLRREGW